MYLKCTIQWFDVFILCEIVTIIGLMNTSITSHGYHFFHGVYVFWKCSRRCLQLCFYFSQLISFMAPWILQLKPYSFEKCVWNFDRNWMCRCLWAVWTSNNISFFFWSINMGYRITYLHFPQFLWVFSAQVFLEFSVSKSFLSFQCPNLSLPWLNLVQELYCFWCNFKCFLHFLFI